MFTQWPPTTHTHTHTGRHSHTHTRGERERRERETIARRRRHLKYKWQLREEVVLSATASLCFSLSIVSQSFAFIITGERIRLNTAGFVNACQCFHGRHRNTYLVCCGGGGDKREYFCSRSIVVIQTCTAPTA